MKHKIKYILLSLLLLFIFGLGILFFIGDKKNIGERNTWVLLKDKIQNTSQEPVNLVICWTPLQMLIAEKIIESHPNEKFYTIVMSHSGKNEKYDYYSSILSQKSERFYSFYIEPQSQNKLFVYTSLLELKLKSLLFPPLKTIYLAHISSPEVHTLVSSYQNAEIRTFDDGSSNLLKKSAFLNNANRISTGDISRKFYEIFINSTQSVKSVRERSIEHYTIFKDLKNIMDDGHRKMTYLPLFDVSKLKPSKEIRDTVKIILGSPEKEMKEISEKAIKHFGIKYATLHPRQRYELSNAITLQSPYIIEDYMLKEIEKNPHTRYEIYTFFSGAALTMKDFPNLRVYALKPSSLPSDYWLTPIYELFQKSNIPILEFDDKEK